MTGLIGALIFCAIVVLVCVVVIWAVEMLLGILEAPPKVAVIARVIIVLIGLLIILNRLLPLALSYT